MLRTFPVRLRDPNGPKGFREGLIGKIATLIPTQTAQGVVEVAKVFWFNYNEDTGEVGEALDAPAPTSHVPQDLVAASEGFYDGDIDLDDDDDEETVEEETTQFSDKPPLVEIPNENPQVQI